MSSIESSAEPGVAGIRRITLRPGVDREAFERFMTDEVFPAAAETPGHVNRASRSTIKSQHLLRAEGPERQYLWVVKSSGVFDRGLFARVFDHMLTFGDEDFQERRRRLETFGEVESSLVFSVVGSFEGAL